MTRLVRVGALSTVLILGLGSLQSADGVESEGLEMGPFGVGYKYLYKLDPSRLWNPLPKKDGETPSGKELRPVRIGVWYPSRKSDSKRMPYRVYVKPEAPDLYFKRLNDVMESYDMWSYGQMFDGDSEAVERLMNTGTSAVLEATPVGGAFPVVLYSAGWYSRSPDNTVLPEYLASHGYVVVTVPQLGPGVVEYDFEVTPGRVDDQIKDLQVALEALRQQSYADTERVATMGFSIGGIVALFLQQRDPRVDAVIGLDPSFLREDWVSLTTSAPGFSAEKSQVPILALYRGHEKQAEDFTAQVLDKLHLADRYLARVLKATHGEFSNEPMLFSMLGHEWLRKDWNTLEDAVIAHQAVMRASLLFLDGVFSASPAGQAGLVQSKRLGRRLATTLVVERKPPHPKSP